MFLSSDKFGDPNDAVKSRLISPVYKYSTESEDTPLNFCIGFAYSIYTEDEDSNDGFDIIIENYLKPEESKVIFFERGMKVFRWYYKYVQVENLDYKQFRVIIFFMNYQ